MRVSTEWQNIFPPVCMLSAEIEQGEALRSSFSFRTVNKCPFHGLLIATFFVFMGLFGDFTI